MIKKIISSGLLLLLLLTMGVSAALPDAECYLEQDFTAPAEETGNPDWKPSDWSIKISGNVPEGTTGVARVTEDGCVVLAPGDSKMAVVADYNFQKKINDDFTIMYDMHFADVPSWYSGVYFDLYINGYNIKWNSMNVVTTVSESGAAMSKTLTNSIKPGLWYTRVIQVKDGNASYYVKERGSDSFLVSGENIPLYKSTINDYIHFYASPVVGAPDVKVSIDNIKVFSGTYLKDAEISVNDVETKKQIVGKLSIEAAQISPVDNTQTVVPMLTVFDRKGKIRSISFGEVEPISFNTGNEYILSSPLYSTEQFEELVGGTAELYCVNSIFGLKPQIVPYSIVIE